MDQKLELPLDKFYEFEKTLADRVFFRQPLNGVWHDITWKEVGQDVRKLATKIKSLNLPEKSCIAIMSKNCSNWIISDLAIWMAGHTSVPLYPTLTSKSIKQILEHSGAKLLFSGKLDEWEKQKLEIPTDIPRVSFPHWHNSDTTSYEEFVGDSAPMEERVSRDVNDIATIIYTSGTTGMPKGVVHSFKSFSYAINKAIPLLGLNTKDQFFSYLPISHVAERLLVELGGLYSGGTISFAESLDTFAANLADTKPTVFLAVPRIWTKFQLGVLNKMPEKKLNLLLKIPVLKGIVKKKIITALGLSEVRVALTGAAPISEDSMQWWDSLGLRIQEAYGMTENMCYGSFNQKGKERFGTIGEIWPGVECKIGDGDEILMKSDANMVGYYKEPELTKEVLSDDGWLRTGDQGKLSKDGYLQITGRVKELFKTSKGKYVAPTPIEKHFAGCSSVEQVCVLGSGMPQPLAIIILSEIGLKKDAADINQEIGALIKDINSKVEGYEALKKIVIVKDDWSVDTGFLTPTFKIKRNEIEKAYARNLESWYGKGESVVIA